MGNARSGSSWPRLASNRAVVEERHDDPATVAWRTGEEAWRPALEALRGAYQDVTLEDFYNSMRTFQHWCDEAGCAGAPVAPATVAGFVDRYSQRFVPKTMEKHIHVIRRVHIVMGLPDPTRSEEVVLALRRARRLRPHRPGQARPITREDRDRLLAQCGSDLRGLRDRALVGLGFDGLCRRSELVGLRIEDLQPQPDGTGRILVRRSEIDVFARGEWAYLSLACMADVAAWLTAAGLTQGPILRRFNHSRVQEGALTSQSVARRVRELACRAGYSPEEVLGFSGHSFRVGAVREMAASGNRVIPVSR